METTLDLLTIRRRLYYPAGLQILHAVWHRSGYVCAHPITPAVRLAQADDRAARARAAIASLVDDDEFE